MKKYFAPVIALSLCIMILFSGIGFTACAEDSTKVTAEPYSTTAPVSEETDYGEIIGDILGDVDPSTGEEIRDTLYETRGILQFFTDLIDKISSLFSDFLNTILGAFTKDSLF